MHRTQKISQKHEKNEAIINKLSQVNIKFKK